MAIFGRLQKLFPKAENDFEDDFEVEDDGVVELINSDAPEADAMSISHLSWGVDFETRANTIYDLISVYRRATVNFEIEDAIDEIVGEAIVKETGQIVNIDMDSVDLSNGIKNKVKMAFDEVLKLLNFHNTAESLFRRWYVDGRLYFQVIPFKNEKKGIKKVHLLSPFDLIRVKIDKRLEKFAADKEIELKGEFAYIWKISSNQLDGTADIRNLYAYDYNDESNGYLISDSMITFVPSGLTDWTGKIYISPLQKSLKPLNQLKLLEDSAVIYRITRAPERRVFFIDVGKLPPKKANAYVQKLIRGFKSKVHYDATTGNLSTQRNILSMIQDYYLPTNSDQKGTKIETLEGGQQLGEITDLFYFKKKLYKSLKVPVERIDDDENPSIELGRSGDMPRKELKFTKFINSLQHKFSYLFMDLLEKQLIYKGVMGKKDWIEIRNYIQFNWQQDSYYAELKDTELLKDQIETATEMAEFVGKYFSNQWVRKQIFRQSDDDIKEQDKLISAEESSGEFDDMEEEPAPAPKPKPKAEPKPEPKKEEPKPEPKKEEKPKKEEPAKKEEA